MAFIDNRANPNSVTLDLTRLSTSTVETRIVTTEQEYRQNQDYYKYITPYIDENYNLRARISALESSFIHFSCMLTGKKVFTLDEANKNLEEYFLSAQKDKIIAEKAEKEAFERLKSISDKI